MSKTVYCMAGGGKSGVNRAYSIRRSAVIYAERHGLVIVDSWPQNDPPPFNRLNDADAWNDYRTRHGCPSA